MKRLAVVLLLAVAGCIPIDPSAAEPGFISCQIDSDCDDGLFCNGLESCQLGICFGGNDPCPNLDCNEQSNTCFAVVSVVDDQELTCPEFCHLDLCDSDCDGWFDDVEIDAGWDPCNAFDPLFCPDTPARICNFIIGCDGLNEADDVFNEPVDTFVSGDVFSFLTPIETDVFLSLISSFNFTIDEQVDIELSLALFDIGCGCCSLVCEAECEAEKDRVRFKRQATITSVDQVLVASGRFVDSIFAFAEIAEFNCCEYPNQSFDCLSLLECGLSRTFTCTIDLPCR